MNLFLYLSVVLNLRIPCQRSLSIPLIFGTGNLLSIGAPLPMINVAKSSSFISFYI